MIIIRRNGMWLVEHSVGGYDLVVSPTHARVFNNVDLDLFGDEYTLYRVSLINPCAQEQDQETGDQKDV